MMVHVSQCREPTSFAGIPASIIEDIIISSILRVFASIIKKGGPQDGQEQE